mmetsp:Transcript_38986/g.93827  ORF Transcript_38986/g.93827 Transcript_38986/m.93827 type:complete len:518 (+) Transcript_38986:97-1650(+)
MFLLRATLRGGGGGGARAISRKLSPSSTLSPSPSGIASVPMTTASTVPAALASSSSSSRILAVRSLSSASGNGGGNDNDDEGDDSKNKIDNNDEKREDLNFLLGQDELPAPPSYVRDAVTGKWTDKERAEISKRDRKLLGMDKDGRGEKVMERLGGRWKEAAAEAAGGAEDGGGGSHDDGLGTLNSEHERVARRIREERLAMGTIGREPADNIVRRGGDGADVDDAEDPSAGAEVSETDRPLTPREYQALKTYAQKEHGVNSTDFELMNDDDAIPRNTLSSGSDAGSADPKQFFDADLDLAYLNPRLNRRAYGSSGEDDDPFAELLPSDFNPARKVNRKHAKPIPRRLLHHNNLSLLRRYTTPGGKIMNRVQSRLGAKDQRKIAKLVKRARHMGLIPHIGQWKFEDHGYLHETGLDAAADDANVGEEAEGKRDWELELEERGLWPLQDETELVSKYYDMGRMMDHIAGPRGKGNRRREELEMLLGGSGALVPEDDKEEKKMASGGGDGIKGGEQGNL